MRDDHKVLPKPLNYYDVTVHLPGWVGVEGGERLADSARSAVTAGARISTIRKKTFFQCSTGGAASHLAGWRRVGV